MRLEIIDEHGQPRVLHGIKRIVARDESTNNPLVAAVEHYQRVHIVGKSGDEDFNTVLKECGILDSVFVEAVNPALLQPRIG